MLRSARSRRDLLGASVRRISPPGVCGAGKTSKQGWNRSYAKAPVPRTDGDRALFLICIPRTDCSEEWLPGGLPCPCRCNAPTSSCLPLIYLGLPGSLPVDPLPSRSQDGPSCIQRISASFRNPLGSRSISMRSVHRDFQSPKTHLSPDGAAGSAAFLNIREPGSHVPVLASGGLHEGAAVSILAAGTGCPASSFRSK